ncbi:Delta-like protein C [Takifugu flavidus]|uniref:Delta-like protein C n=1 Tax=Takifugu flavidus TaxID=433684 RepID=A0A5C6PFG6_9TELE|nr:Delta-like protein C [Takifugu flavidus]
MSLRADMTRLLLPCLLLSCPRTRRKFGRGFLFSSAGNLPSLCPPQTFSSGVFELKIDSFTSSRSVCSSSSRDCQIFFRVCLKHSQDVIDPEPPCTYGTALTDTFGPTPTPSPTAHPSGSPSLSNGRNALGCVSCLNRSFHENQNNLISRLAAPPPADRGRGVVAGRARRQPQRAALLVPHGVQRVLPRRDVLHPLSARNDQLGYFSCDNEGNKVCQEGWSGEYCSNRE